MPDGQRVAAGQAGSARGRSCRYDIARAVGQVGMTHTPGSGQPRIPVGRIVRSYLPPAALLVRNGRPGEADDRQRHLAGRRCPGSLLGEVHAQLDHVHIHEDLAVADRLTNS